MWDVWIEMRRPCLNLLMKTDGELYATIWFFHTPNHAPRKNVLTDSVKRDILILLEVIEGALRA